MSVAERGENDAAFVEAFERCEIAPDAFHHGDHVRLAWYYLKNHELLVAIELFRAALRRFAAHHGASGLYHETITVAFILLIHDRMARSEETCWTDFETGNPALMSWKPSLLERYYTAQTLASPLARRSFLFPDAMLGL